LQETTGGILVVDEAYGEFAHDKSHSAVTLLEGRPKLLVSRTMSKAFAFAGARVGYLAADPAVIDALRLVRLPYHLSAFTQAAAEGALAHSADMLETVDDIREQRDRIVSELVAMGLDPYRTDANFVLFAGLDDASAVWQQLLDRGVLVRDMGIAGTLRVSAGTESETSRFLAALREVIGK
jgi:histidinol-phosphate aminotransferase